MEENGGWMLGKNVKGELFSVDLIFWSTFFFFFGLLLSRRTSLLT